MENKYYRSSDEVLPIILSCFEEITKLGSISRDDIKECGVLAEKLATEPFS